MDKKQIVSLVASVMYKTLAFLGFYFIASMVLFRAAGEMAYQANSLLLLIASMLFFFIINPHARIEWKSSEELETKDDDEQRKDD